MNSIKDSRKNPVVSCKIVAESVILGASLGDRSLRAMDQTMRQPGLRKSFGCNRSLMVSDTTISRVSEGMGEESVEPLLERVYEKLKSQGFCKVEVEGKRLRVGVIDGSGIGGQLASFLMLLGEVPTILALRRCEMGGKELPVSLRILRETAQRWGRGFLDLILGDGLYPTTSFWKTCHSIGSEGVVKTDEVTLSIVQDANGIFDAPQLLPGVEFVSGTDAQRGCTYKVWAVEELQWSNSELLLKVARIEETYLKGKRAGQVIRFWSLSQNQTLSALPLRKLGHWRWAIENN